MRSGFARRKARRWVPEVCARLAHAAFDRELATALPVPLFGWEGCFARGLLMKCFRCAHHPDECRQGPGRPPGSGKHVYLVSGLLRCGLCGGGMSIIGRKKKAGVSYTRFGCTAHASRGNSVCRHSMSISEKKVTRTVVNALKQKLDRPELIERFIRVFKEKTAARLFEHSKVTDEADRRIRDVERRIANLTDSLARVGWSEALAAKLRDEEAQLAKLKTARAASTQPPPPRIVPHPATIAAYLKSLWTLLEADPARGRDVLSRFVAPVVLTPMNAENPGRSYRATGAFNFSFFLSGAFSGSGISSCAGAQCGLCTAITLRFERRLAA